MIQLLIQEIEDPVIRENFRRIQRELTEIQVLLKGEWKFFEITFTGVVTDFDYPHKLGFVPKDIIQTYITPGEAILWNHESFDKTNINVTTTGACTVRAFIGSYLESAGQL